MPSQSSSQSSSSGWWTAITGHGSQSTSSNSSGLSGASGGVVGNDKKKIAAMVTGATFFAGSLYLLYCATQHPLFRAWKQGWKKYYSLSESERTEILRDLRKHQHSPASSTSATSSCSVNDTSSSSSNSSSNKDEVVAAVEKIKQYLKPSSEPPALIFISLESLLIESSDAWYQLFSHAAMELFGLDDLGVETDEFRAEWWREGLHVTYERLKSKAHSRTSSNASSSNTPSLPFELFQAYATYHFADFLPFLRLNPHAERLLKAAKSTGSSLALVTNMDRNILQLVFEMFPILSSYFQLDASSSTTSNVFCAGDITSASSSSAVVCAPFPSSELLSTAAMAIVPGTSDRQCSQCLFLASSSFEVQAASQSNCLTLSVQNESLSPSDRLLFVKDESLIAEILVALAAK